MGNWATELANEVQVVGGGGWGVGGGGMHEDH